MMWLGFRIGFLAKTVANETSTGKQGVPIKRGCYTDRGAGTYNDRGGVHLCRAWS